MLDRTGYSPEEQRRRFCNLVLAADDRPFTYAQWLADFARRWLQPEVQSAAAVVEQVVLESVVVGVWFRRQLQERVDVRLSGDRQNCVKSGNWQQLSNGKIALIAWALFRSEPGT